MGEPRPALGRASDKGPLRFARGAVTEAGNKPDFLFPNTATYQAAETGAPGLVMLAAKSTCKDRWRQILLEAVTIPRKHLVTLEPGTSSTQTVQMQGANIQLINPVAIHKSCTDSQRETPWALKDFIGEVQERQQAGTNSPCRAPIAGSTRPEPSTAKGEPGRIRGMRTRKLQARDQSFLPYESPSRVPREIWEHRKCRESGLNADFQAGFSPSLPTIYAQG